MNKIYKLILFTFAALSQPLFAQESAVGYFRLANATGLHGKLNFLMDGADINAKGYDSGETTGSLGVAVPTVLLKAVHPLCESAEFQINLTPGEQVAVIAYVEPQKDQKTGEVKKRILKFSKLERKPKSRKKSATLLFLSVSQSIQIKMNDAPVELQTLKQTDIGFGDSRDNGVSIKVGQQEIGSLDIEESGDYAVIIFDKADGTQGCITFYNSRHRG